MTGTTNAASWPRDKTGAAAAFVMLLIVLVAALSTTQSSGSPSLDPTVNAAVLTPDTGSGAEAALLQTESDDAADEPSDTEPRIQRDDAAITARSYVALDMASGDTLLARDADREIPIASTVKIATALVALEYVDLADEVLILESDLVDYMVHSNMALVAGDVLTVEQLLHGVLIASGSDGANALARHVGERLGDGDPIARFVDAMNEYAQANGMEHTQFANPTGDDDPDAYSSARDIARLGAELMANETLAAIVGMPSYSFISVGNGAEYVGNSTNQLLGVDGVVGIKTGSTGPAGGCVIIARESRDGMQVIAVLGSDLEYQENVIVLDARWDDARRIFTLLEG